MLTGKKILIADDEPDLREILKDEFALLGAQVSEVSNGLDGYQAVEKGDFDLVISDIRMPGGDGFEFGKAVKKRNPKKPVFVLITGFADVTAEQAKSVGIDGLYNKPFSLEAFCNEVTRLLN